MKNIYVTAPPVVHSPARVTRFRRCVRVLSLVLLLAIIAVPSDSNRAHAASGEPAVEAPVVLVSCYGVYHVVRPGQTLYSIAAAYRTTAYRIAICNGLGAYSVYAGQALLVPIYRQTR